MRPKILGVGLIVALLLVGCGSSSGDTTKAATTTAAASTTSATDGAELEPAKGVLASTTLKVIAAENDCIADKPDQKAAFDCLSKPTLLANASSYLEEETEATPKQVACVVTILDGFTVEKARAVMLSGIGQAAYVPCGLPD